MIVKLIDGREVELAPRYGKTRAHVEEALTKDVLTGSAVVLDSAWLELAGGGTLRYSAIVQFIGWR